MWILHAKVAQKSYGTEKRFFCPPPCVYLAGPGWRVKPMQDQVHQSADTGPTVCGYMGLDGASGSAPETQKLNFEEQPDSREFGCAKTLFISDADKRKHFRLVLRLVQRGGRELGTFHSRLIKVISKPSQKKQSLKNTDREKGVYLLGLKGLPFQSPALPDSVHALPLCGRWGLCGQRKTVGCLHPPPG